MIFRRCNGLRLNGLTHKNSPGSHIIVTASNDVVISNLHIVAPENSRNTDGIDIASSSKVKISDCQIHTGFEYPKYYLNVSILRVQPKQILLSNTNR